MSREKSEVTKNRTNSEVSYLMDPEDKIEKLRIVGNHLKLVLIIGILIIAIIVATLVD
jgi:hypothetical protein